MRALSTHYVDAGRMKDHFVRAAPITAAWSAVAEVAQSFASQKLCGFSRRNEPQSSKSTNSALPAQFPLPLVSSFTQGNRKLALVTHVSFAPGPGPWVSLSAWYTR